jgi:two-component system NarL family sensor kinase
LKKAPDLAELTTRLAEAEEALRAIRAGEVDAVVVEGRHGPQVFTLEGEEHAYRVLIESMNEGALTLTADKTILYANQCFARMVKCPLQKVSGGSFSRFISAHDRTLLRHMLSKPRKTGSQIQLTLQGSDGSLLPVCISIRPMEKLGSESAAFSMVVTDMTDAKRSEERLRALTHRVVQAQEAERGRVAHELHDTITQTLCGILVHSQTLANGLSTREKVLKAQALRLCDMVGKTVGEVERISRNLRPSVLDNLGLVAGLRSLGLEFTARAGLPVEMDSAPLTAPVAGDTELALYRILQEALRNVEKHAHAGQVTISLSEEREGLLLRIRDDGKGFDPDRPPVRREKTLLGKPKGGLGLLGLRERAASVGGSLKIVSARRKGTEIEVWVPSAALVSE